VECGGLALSQPASSHRDHVRPGVDSIDAQATLDEQLGELPGPASHFEDTRARIQAAALDRVIDERRRIAGANGVVCRRNTVERLT
jgi:hypothetical protein